MKTTKDAAAKLGVTEQRVCQLIRGGKIPATWVAGRYLIDDRVLAEFAKRKRPVGRPRVRG